MMCLRWERRRSASRSADRANRPHELGGHIRGALTNGATGQEIQEVLLQTMACYGAPAVWSPSASPRPSWPRRPAHSSSTSKVGSRPALSSRHRAIAPLGRLRLVEASVRQCLNNEVGTMAMRHGQTRPPLPEGKPIGCRLTDRLLTPTENRTSFAD
jgi:hypothetical protein